MIAALDSLALLLSQNDPSRAIAMHGIDIAIIVAYCGLILVAGWYLSKRASQDIDSYFLADKSLPWWVIGTSHGASGFDIAGTMWFVAAFFTYGVKSAFIPWIWPLFDRVFRQVYLGPWIRKSNVLTGAEWMKTRFGSGRAGTLSHMSVVVYAIVVSVGFLCLAYEGIGRFAVVFFPWDLSIGPISSADSYAIAILLFTLAYLLLGGWYSVVLTDLIQFVILTLTSVFIAYIAMTNVSREALQAATPEGWDSLQLGWQMNLDWSNHVEGLNEKIKADNYDWFGWIIAIMFGKGLMVSMAGPTPGYGMQHQLSVRNAREAALENWWMSIVQLIPRFLMISGIAVLGLVYFTPMVREMTADGGQFDFEQVLPLVIRDFVPVGLVGFLVAGLLAAFMSTFDSTVNAGAAYVVNDIYKRYINPRATQRRYVVASYLASILLVVVGIVFALSIDSIDDITKWLTFALYGGYAVPNILKWHWWRFNGYGYFAGMISGVLAAIGFKVLNETGVWQIEDMYSFFLTAPVAAFASVVATLMTPPDDEQVLKQFYYDVRPWGFWDPIYQKVKLEHPDVEKNHSFSMDMINVAIGIVWQLMLIIVPVALVIRRWDMFLVSLGILAITSLVMKFTWWDRLDQFDPK
ncbi:sodium:solute symporter family protein [Novipirellula artificiosorum]|uniref:Sodium/glucose cotransporter n=1 Tax=Novipirellula artificiosorum TaxID=2528016 RepID=A0A5C6DGF0_9BACT|nr:sodium:solute symporter family protein [Novipirellula artificiosorum]TWU35054.1 Sodium/glucose cotransporter [Novipirellula artificiosorum]